MADTYNGWTNYPTWNLKLWIDNDEGLYTHYQEIVGDLLEGILLWTPGIKGDTYQTPMTSDLLAEMSLKEARDAVDAVAVVDNKTIDTREAYRDAVYNIVEHMKDAELYPIDERGEYSDGVKADLYQWALSQINYREIAASIAEDILPENIVKALNE